MRYCDYLKESVRLEKTIAESWQREVKALSGKGPWFVRLFPGLRDTAIDVAVRKRGAAALKRAKLQSDFFTPSSTLYNAAAVAAFRPVVPGSEDDIAYLRDAAAASLNSQR